MNSATSLHCLTTSTLLKTSALLKSSTLATATLLVLSLMTNLTVTPANAAVGASFVCSNPDNINDINDFQDNCTLDPVNSFGIKSLLEMVGEIQSCSTQGVEGEFTTQCQTSTNLNFTCTADQAGVVTCTFPDNTQVSCTEDEQNNNVSCNITPDEELTNSLQSVLGTTDATIPTMEMARVLASICPSRTTHADLQRECDSLMTLLNSGTTDNLMLVATILDEIAPSFASISLDLATNGASAQDQNVQKRLRSIRNQKNSASQTAVADQLSTLLATRQLIDGIVMSPNLSQPLTGGTAGDETAIAESFSKLGGFVNATILSAEKDPTTYELASDSETVAFTAGLDYQLSTQYVMGLALGLTNTTTDVSSNNGTFDLEGYTMTFYGSYHPVDSFYMDYSVSYTGNDYDQQRDIVYTGVNQTASAKYDGSLTSLSLGGGYLWHRDALAIDGFAQLIHLTANVGKYTEDMSNSAAAGSGWALAMDSQELTSLTFHLGGQATYVFNKRWGVITPLTRLELVSELDDDPRLVTGRFVGDIGDRIAFSVQTDEVDTSYLNIGVGVSAVMTGGKSFYAYYQSTISYDDISQSQLNFGGRMEF